MVALPFPTHGNHSALVVDNRLISGDGKKIASVGLDNEHSIVVWDWRRGDKLATTRYLGL